MAYFGIFRCDFDKEDSIGMLYNGTNAHFGMNTHFGTNACEVFLEFIINYGQLPQLGAPFDFLCL